MPSQQEYISASQAVYLRVGTTPISVPGLTPLVGPNGQLVYSSIDADGFYAAAYTDAAGNIIITYEGSLPGLSNLYGINSGVADAEILNRQSPSALQDAVSFAQTVLQDAQALGVNPNQVFVTGHSLGGAEAEAVSAATGLEGATFGAPGLPGYVGSGSQPDLVNYVAYGDPVANYASDSSEEQGFAPSGDMDHVGTVEFTGNASNADVLEAASTEYSLSEKLSDRLVFVGLGLFLNLDNHLLSNYGSVLDLTVPQGFDSAPGPYDVLFALDAPLGASGAVDFDAARFLNTGTLASADFTVNVNSDGSVCTIIQQTPIDTTSWTSASDPGTLVADLRPTASNSQTATFYDSANGDVSDLTFDASTGVEKLAVTNSPTGTSSVTSFDYTNLSLTSVSTTDYTGPNGTGSVTEIDRENSSGTSQITIYNADGSTTTTSYSGLNGTGSTTEVDQENADGTSQETFYTPTEQTVELVFYYSAPTVESPEELTKVDEENADGTSQLTLVNPDGSLTTTTYSGLHETGNLITSINGVYETEDGATIENIGIAFAGPHFVLNLADIPSGSLSPGYRPTMGYSHIEVTSASADDTLLYDVPYNVARQSPDAWVFSQAIPVDGGYELSFVSGDTGYFDNIYFDSDIQSISFAATGSEADITFDQDPIAGATVVTQFGLSNNTILVTVDKGETASLDPLLGDSNIATNGTIEMLLIVQGPGTATINGNAPINGFQVAAGGNLEVIGGTVDTDPFAILAGGSLTGFGTITGNALNNGTVTANGGGTLDLTGTITGSGTLSISPGGDLALVGSVAASESIRFDNVDETLLFSEFGHLSSSVTGFGPGDSIGLQGDKVGAAIYNPDTGTLIVRDSLGFLADLDLNGTYQQGNFSVVGGEIEFTPLCFLAGTRIVTPSGEIPIEQLTAGDSVLTLRGEVRPIVWVGEGRVLATRNRRNAATPVIVRKGALADNVPNCDLRITKAHALYIDNVLIPVEFLVNHHSIVWDDHAQEVILYHIELESHDVLLANGAPAESYRDDGNRWLFHNAYSARHLPWQMSCAPVVTGGPIVDAAWRRLLDRTGPHRSVPLTDDPDLHLLVDGQRVDAAERRGVWNVFRLAARPTAVRIVSRSAVPQELGLSRDSRCLGVALRQIMVRKGLRVRMIDAGDELLKDGFHSFESGDKIRWTDGNAAAPETLFDGFAGSVELLLNLCGSTSYLDHGSIAQVA